MRTDRTISLSTWNVHWQRTKNNLEKYEVEGIVVVGKNLAKISKNPIFVGRVYQKVFGKDKWEKYRDMNALKVVRIKLGSTHGESSAPDGDKIFE